MTKTACTKNPRCWKRDGHNGRHEIDEAHWAEKSNTTSRYGDGLETAPGWYLARLGQALHDAATLETARRVDELYATKEYWRLPTPPVPRDC